MEDLIKRVNKLKLEDKVENEENKLDIDNEINLSLIKDLDDIIKKNEYIKLCKSNKNKDINSISYLIDRQLSQSDCIKLGHGIEKILQDIILNKNSNLINIRPKNIKNKKEKDHLFVNKKEKIIYYAELKSNLYLDTEKCKSTYIKCQQIILELQEEFPEYSIKMFLIGVRYYDKNIIPDRIIKKYLPIKENIVGINDYLKP
jgi:hypothetical protein